MSPVYHEHIDYGQRRMDDMRRDPHINVWVNARGGEWRDHDYHYVVVDRDRFVERREYWHDRYRPWWHEGFYGGCYWEFHPYIEIDTYFYNPFITWFYVPVYDEVYYRGWYGDEYDRWVELRTPFRRVGIFYPTEEFRDLNVGVSALVVERQIRYRRAMEIFSDRLELELKLRGGATLAARSVVISHYQVLPNDRGFVVEGSVDQDDIHFDFKAFQDLDSPEQTAVYAASGDEAPTDAQIDELQRFNTRILDVGGVAEADATVQSEQPAPTAPAAPEAPAPGSEGSNWGDSQ